MLHRRFAGLPEAVPKVAIGLCNCISKRLNHGEHGEHLESNSDTSTDPV